MVGLIERRALTAIQYPDQEFVMVGVANEPSFLPRLAPRFAVDPWAYHRPLFMAFRARAKVPELPESDFEPDELL